MPAALLIRATHARFPLSGVCWMGRSREATLCLNDTRVSRQHAMIREQGDGKFGFYDLGSVNGSFLNGQRVISGCELKPGDVIRIIDSEFVFECDTPAAPVEVAEDLTTAVQIRSLPVLIMVSDIKGYTPLSQRLDPAKLAQVVGSWYRECSRIIPAEGGIIDKFIGDAVLAYWTDTADREKVLKVVGEMQVACARIQEAHADCFPPKHPAFGCGYALHAGPVALGSMGHGAYTLLGDTVNVAFRLQGLTRTLESDCLATADFVAGLAAGVAQITPKGDHAIKGHSARLHVHAVTTA